MTEEKKPYYPPNYSRDTTKKLAAKQLREAAQRIESGDPSTTVWRVAEACVMLRQLVAEPVPGIDKPTDTGAFLEGHHDDFR